MKVKHLTFALLATIVSMVADAVEPDVSAIQPHVTLRESGYLLGDLVEENIELPLPDGFALDNDALPLPGRVAPWMEVRRSRVDHGNDSKKINIAVVYQIFAEVEQTSRVPIPAFKLRVRDGDKTQSVIVPEQSFLLSPALPPSLADEDRVVKPSPLPRTLPIAGIVLRFVAAMILALVSALYLLWTYDRLPFFPRSPGPFARMWRRWRSRGKRELSVDDQQSLLRDWHTALNQAAGETVYASTLPRLFERASHLAPLKGRIETLFSQSWRHFYTAQEMPSSAQILDVLRTSAERERGVPC
jgi:mxaA protein